MSRSQLIVRKPAYKPWKGYRIFARKMPRNQQPPVIERSLLNRWEYVPNKESKTLISRNGPEFVKPRSGITISWMHKYGGMLALQEYRRCSFFHGLPFAPNNYKNQEAKEQCFTMS